MIMMHLLIPSLLASFKTSLSEFCTVKLVKVSPRKAKTNSMDAFGQFLQFLCLPFIAVVHI